MASLRNPRGRSPCQTRGLRQPPPVTRSPPGPGPAPPAPHLALELALLLEAEVLRGVGHHGEGLLGVVSAGQEGTSGGHSGGRAGASGLLTDPTLSRPGLCPRAGPVSAARQRRSDPACADLGDTTGSSGRQAVENGPEPKGGHRGTLRVPDHPCLGITHALGVYQPGTSRALGQHGAKIRMGSGRSFQLKPEMEANEGEEGQEGYRARNEGERDVHIQEGFLEEEEEEEAGRERRCTHPEWPTRANLREYR